MISFLKGQVILKASNYFVLLVNNIGYGIFAPDTFLSDIKLESDLAVFTHQYVREEALDLYGFRNLEDLELFELLISISGIGPKSALGVLNIASGSDIKEAIVRGDSRLLTKVSGIGAKTAERIVLELKDKINKMFTPASDSGLSMASGDEIDALMALGYSMTEAREALRGLPTEMTDTSERIRSALKKMKK